MRHIKYSKTKNLGGCEETAKLVHIAVSTPPTTTRWWDGSHAKNCGKWASLFFRRGGCADNTTMTRLEHLRPSNLEVTGAWCAEAGIIPEQFCCSAAPRRVGTPKQPYLRASSSLLPQSAAILCQIWQIASKGNKLWWLATTPICPGANLLQKFLPTEGMPPSPTPTLMEARGATCTQHKMEHRLREEPCDPQR
jgi:hypothetical protein